MQVHDELVLDVYKPELEEVKVIVYDGMINAMPITAFGNRYKIGR